MFDSFVSRGSIPQFLTARNQLGVGHLPALPMFKKYQPFGVKVVRAVVIYF